MAVTWPGAVPAVSPVIGGNNTASRPRLADALAPARSFGARHYTRAFRDCKGRRRFSAVFILAEEGLPPCVGL